VIAAFGRFETSDAIWHITGDVEVVAIVDEGERKGIEVLDRALRTFEAGSVGGQADQVGDVTEILVSLLNPAGDFDDGVLALAHANRLHELEGVVGIHGRMDAAPDHGNLGQLLVEISGEFAGEGNETTFDAESDQEGILPADRLHTLPVFLVGQRLDIMGVHVVSALKEPDTREIGKAPGHAEMYEFGGNPVISKGGVKAAHAECDARVEETDENNWLVHDAL